jgi:hypothetical protein
MDALRRQPFVAVVGASGSGKSSVVRAGLVPRLRSDRRTAWGTVILVPPDQPLKALAKALVALLEPNLSEVDRLTESAKLAECFLSRTISLYDIIERVLEKQPGTNRVLIVVDQFEEFYTLTPDEEARRHLTSDEEVSRRLTLEEETRRRFLNELLATGSRPGSRANVVLTLRGDFVGRALAYRPLSDRLQGAQINLGPMTRKELERAIRKPAERIELEFETGLVERILNDVGEERGNLPLLEFVLKELWDKRRGRVLLNETYDAIGGLQGAVATKADQLFNGLSPTERKVLKRVFLRIVRPAKDGLDTRRRAAFTELPPEGAELVLKLANERLLVTNQSAISLERTIEVAHEALISNWSTLRVWVNEDREFLLWRDRLGTLLTAWEGAQESDDALLRGPLLIEAQKWFDQRSQDLSDQERKFISTSRDEKERLAQQEREAAQRLAKALDATQHALTDSFFRTIGTFPDAGPGVSVRNITTPDEREALWELAQLDRANVAVRGALLNRWFGTVEAFCRGKAHDGQGLRAAIGLNVEFHQLATSKAAELGRCLAARLENPQETDSDRLSHLTNTLAALDTLAALAYQMEPQPAVEIARRGAERLVAVLENLRSTEFWLSGRGDTLAALAHRMEPQPAAKIARCGAECLAAALEALDDRDEKWEQRLRLATELAALAHRMEPQPAAKIARRGVQRLVAALEKQRGSISYNKLFNPLLSFGGTLAALANRMERQVAAELAEYLVAALEKLPEDTNSNWLCNLAIALTALADRLEPQSTANVAKRGAQRLLLALEKTLRGTRFYLRDYVLLSEALAALASRMEPQPAADVAGPVAQHLVAILEMENSQEIYVLSDSGNVLASLANSLEQRPAADIARWVAQRLVATLENPQETDSRERLLGLAKALTSLANRLEPQHAADAAGPVALRLIATLENPQEADSERLLSLANALVALADRMERQAAIELARGVARRFVTALENPQETDSERLSSLGNALAAFCRLLPAAPRTHLLALSNLLLRLPATHSPVPVRVTKGTEQLFDWKLLSDLCAQLNTEDVVEVLKYPFCTPPAEQIVLDQLEAKTQREFSGEVWKFVGQADSSGTSDSSSTVLLPSAPMRRTDRWMPSPDRIISPNKKDAYCKSPFC